VFVLFQTDPLFNKTSAAFDEGGTAGLLLNHLHCRDDMSELVLDSNTVMSEVEEHGPQTQETQTKLQPAAMKDLKSRCRRHLL
jgi:condensin complex subunit 2